MSTPGKSDVKSNLIAKILIPVMAVLTVLVIAIFVSQKVMPSIRRRSKRSVLPVTNIPPRGTFFQRRLDSLRVWWKPTFPSGVQSDSLPNTTEAPTVTKPSAARLPQNRDPLTYQGWSMGNHTQRCACEEERYTKLQEKRKPRVFAEEFAKYQNQIAEQKNKPQQVYPNNMEAKMEGR